jgi:hypothetical protein
MYADKCPSLSETKEPLIAVCSFSGVFLERYGDLLSRSERAYFEPLRSDYEVDFYLRLLDSRDEQNAQVSPRI